VYTCMMWVPLHPHKTVLLLSCYCLLLCHPPPLRPVSGSEDTTVRLWNAGGSCLQVLEHPGCVWTVAFTARGELVSGCSDAVGRVWSSDPERKVGHPAAQCAAACGGGGGRGGDDCTWSY
jgi:WD40 repeat protein